MSARRRPDKAFTRARAGLRIGDVVRATVRPYSGEAVAEAVTETGAVLRVHGGVPGDVADVRIVGLGQHSTWAELVSVVSPGEHRIVAPCAVARACGGCPWQASAYPAQLEAKLAWLKGILDRASLTTLVHAVVPTEPPLGYRTKLQMPAAGAGADLKLGFWAPGTRRHVTADPCVVQDVAGERTRAAVMVILREAGVAAFDPDTGLGELRTVLIRVAGTPPTVAVVLVAAQNERDWAPVGHAIGQLPDVASVWLNINVGLGAAVLGAESRLLAGSPTLTETLAGAAIDLDPLGFFQTNRAGAAAIVATLRERLPARIGHLLDLYAGTGFLGVALATRADAITAIESHVGTATLATRNLDRAGATARVLTGLVETQLPSLALAFGPVDVAIADPPRAGLHPTALAALIAHQPERIAYVSCGPETFVRDARLLVQAGYQLTDVVPVDMFPHGPHLELVAFLTRPSQRPPNAV